MDPFGPPRKRPRPETVPYNGVNGHGLAAGQAGDPDCKLLLSLHCSRDLLYVLFVAYYFGSTVWANFFSMQLVPMVENNMVMFLVF
jgi:hypothetical protein